MIHRGMLTCSRRGKSDVPLAFRLLDELKWQIDRGDAAEKRLLTAVLTGGPVHLFGKPARIRLEWLEGLPAGMTEEDVRQRGEKMRLQADALTPDRLS